jgi:hypothetical protein
MALRSIRAVTTGHSDLRTPPQGVLLYSLTLAATACLLAGCASSVGPADTNYRLALGAYLRNESGQITHDCSVRIGFTAPFPLPDSLDPEAAAAVERSVFGGAPTLTARLQLIPFRLKIRPGTTALLIVIEGPGVLDTLVATGGQRADPIYSGNWTCDGRIPLADDPVILEAGYPPTFRADGTWSLWGPPSF